MGGDASLPADARGPGGHAVRVRARVRLRFRVTNPNPNTTVTLTLALTRHAVQHDAWSTVVGSQG